MHWLPEPLRQRVRLATRAAHRLCEGDEEGRAAWHQLLLSCAIDQTLPRLTGLTAARENQLRSLLESLPEEVTHAVDLLGCAYETWQSATKQQIRTAGGKIGAKELPPVTQLFTDRYLVTALLNAAWHDARPHDASFRLCDPCCGAGAFLLEAFARLVPERMQRERLTPAEAVDAVLTQNLHGLEIDPFCTELAAASLSLAAWQSPDTAERRELPPLQIACSGNAPFPNAPLLGSLLSPDETTPARSASEGSTAFDSHPQSDHTLSLAGASGWCLTGGEALRMLRGPYACVITNVPYVARGKQHPDLQAFCAEHYPDSRQDLATVFLERCLQLTMPGGTTALVLPQNWMYLKQYQRLRRRLLAETTWQSLVRLGEKAFTNPHAAGAFSILLVLTRTPPSDSHEIQVRDISAGRTPAEKADLLPHQLSRRLSQAGLLLQPEARIVLENLSSIPRLSDYADVYAGLQTADYPRYVRCFWELPRITPPWVRYQRAPMTGTSDTGASQILHWDNGAALADNPAAVIRGRAAWGKEGVIVGLLRSLPSAEYSGEIFDQSAAVLIPKRPEWHGPIARFAASEEYRTALRQLDAKLNLAPATLNKVVFDLDRWQSAASAPTLTRTTDPTQWTFDGQCASSSAPRHVALARIFGYRWPTEPPAALPIQSVRVLQTPADWTALAEDVRYETGDQDDDDLEDWLRDRFFLEHCRLFQQRPFLWHLWDGQRDGLHLIVNYHAFDRSLLERLIRHDLAERRGAGVLRSRLQQILDGEPPYDLFIRWKPPTAQPHGWDPDLADGVRVNIRPFFEAGLLRRRPAIHWRPDRGRDAESSPWFEQFHGQRVNDWHRPQASAAGSSDPPPVR